jgi:outer membrane protein TolC
MCGLALMCIGPGQGEGEDLTHAEAVSRAVAVSGAVEVQELAAREAVLDAENARARWYPQVFLGADAAYVNKVMQIPVPGRTIRFGDNESYDLSVSLNQNVYDAGRIRALELANGARARMSRQNADAARLQAAFGGKTAFFRVILAGRLLDAAEQSREEAVRHRETVSALEGQGMALRNDVVRADLRIANADLDIASQRSELARSLASLRSAVGLPADEPLALSWSGSYEPDLADTVFQHVVEARPEFAAFDAAEEASLHAVDVARAALYPAVGFNAGFHYGRPGLDLPANEWMSYATAGLRLTWNVWDWGANRREIQKTRLSVERVRENRDDFARAVERDLEQALATWHEMRQRLALARQSAEFAAQNLEVLSVSFREGMATETEYDNAFTAYTVANINAAAAEVSVWISAAQVEHVLGVRNTGDSDE